MVQHAQTVRRLKPTNYLSVFDHFVGLSLKGLRVLWLPVLKHKYRGNDKRNKKIDIIFKSMKKYFISNTIYTLHVKMKETQYQ